MFSSRKRTEAQKVGFLRLLVGTTQRDQLSKKTSREKLGVTNVADDTVKYRQYEIRCGENG
jgi:hypothetical protein